eukprot:CAMPEP_0173273282 /NCGR_PEP_ID=MMETSP1143-20121109/1816_1 /TAXON_ID=483371 /ORGANISM="non described non described, Strain CCMP2298" /LENGTH=101 /DNA_ID=CAMNT_0014210001 /DNA_START=98 /DNA_END=400 /DNA_ORIENTATION=+
MTQVRSLRLVSLRGKPEEKPSCLEEDSGSEQTQDRDLLLQQALAGPERADSPQQMKVLAQLSRVLSADVSAPCLYYALALKEWILRNEHTSLLSAQAHTPM